MKSLDWNGARVGVLGVARSGLALARVLQARGASVLLSDSRPEAQLGSYLEQAQQLGVAIETGGHGAGLVGIDALIISPGVSIYAPVVQQSLQSGVPVLGEVEVAWQFCPKPLIAVTGTNGKSTTASLIQRALAPRSVLAGNIGVPLVAEVTRDLSGIDWVVAEISSFQLETVHGFRPRVAILTNITPDHLDRHPSVEEYISAKCRVFWQQQAGDIAILNADDPDANRVAGMLERGEPLPEWVAGFEPRQLPSPGPTVYRYSVSAPVERGCWFQDGAVMFRDGAATERLFGWNFPNLPGGHNLSNGLAAALAARLLGVPAEQTRTAFAGYPSLHHRLELVGNVGPVRFIDDSKATNVSSVEAALSTYREPIVLIAGGRDKGLDLDLLGQHIARYCTALVVIGEAAETIADSATRHGLKLISRAASMDEAVERAFGLAQSRPSVVLLSPACTSFDMFLNAEDRGDRFADSVRKLQQKLAGQHPNAKEGQ